MSAPPPPSMPSLPSFDNIDLSRIAGEPDYLEYDQKGRSPWEKTVFNTGASYLVGTIGGSLYGLKTGLQSVPGASMRVRSNAVLNHAGRYGSKAGNAMGAVCLIYSMYEALIDNTPVGTATDALNIEPVNPALAALLAGAHYKSTAGPRVALLAGTIGAGAVGATYLGSKVSPYAFGSRGFLFF